MHDTDLEATVLQMHVVASANTWCFHQELSHAMHCHAGSSVIVW